MKAIVVFFELLFFAHAVFSLEGAGFVQHEALSPNEFQLWMEGSVPPSGAEWLSEPQTGKTLPSPVVGESYLAVDAGQKTSVNYFLGAARQAYFDTETVFIVWIFVEKKPEYISMSFHEIKQGWKGAFFGSLKETGRMKQVSKKLPAAGKWHAFILNAAEIFSTAEGGIDGFAIETSNGRILVDSVAIADTEAIPAGSIPEISFSLDKNVFLKGETLSITGKSSAEALVTALSSGRKIFSETVIPDENKNFFLKYTVEFSDPSGEWAIFASTPFNEVSEKISVSANTSGLLEVNFLSPVSAHFEKNSTISIIAKVSLLGKPVEEARVNAWGVFGERIVLESKGNGIYSTDYKIPFHAPAGNWEMLAVAANEKNIFGESRINLSVTELTPKIELLSPSPGEFNFGEPLLVRIKAYYSEEHPVSSASAKLLLNMPVESPAALTLKHTGDGVFETLVPTNLFSNKPLEARVLLTTGIDKSFQRDFQILPESYVFNFLKANVLLLAFPVLLIAIGLVVWLSRRSHKPSLKELLRKKQSILGELKKLEHDYYKKNLFSSSEFRQKKLELKSGIDSIDIKLKTSKQQ